MRRFLSPKIYFFAFLFIAIAWALIAYRETTQSQLNEAGQELEKQDGADSNSMPEEVAIDGLPKEIMDAIDAEPTSSLPQEEVILPNGMTLQDWIDQRGITLDSDDRPDPRDED